MERAEKLEERLTGWGGTGGRVCGGALRAGARSQPACRRRHADARVFEPHASPPEQIDHAVAAIDPEREAPDRPDASLLDRIYENPAFGFRTGRRKSERR